MSWYYNYYLGYENHDNGMIYPLGPYDANGKLCSVYYVSRSFSSDLHDMFWTIGTNMVSDELKKEFPHYTSPVEDYIVPLEYIPFDELPVGDGIRRGYFLLSDIDLYEKNSGDFDPGCLFSEWLTPTAYCEKLTAELSGVHPIPKKDVEGVELEQYSAAEYGYYAYLDKSSAEYEAYLIRNAARAFEYSKCLAGNNTIVVLKTEG